MLTFAVFVLALGIAQAQFANTCLSCAGLFNSNGNICGSSNTGSICNWCATSSTGGFCYAGPGQGSCSLQGDTVISNSAQCPAPPPPISSASIVAQLGGTAAIAGAGPVAALILGVLLYTNLERFPGKPSASPAVSRWALHAMFSAAALLWLAGGFLLAAPSVPWLYFFTNAAQQQVVVVSPLFVSQCFVSGGGFPICPIRLSMNNSPEGVRALNMFGAGAPPVAFTDAVAAAGAIAACAYAFTLLLLLPAAVFVSLSAYRLKNHLAHGAALPAEGCCVRSNFAIGTALAVLGSIATAGTVIGAFVLSGPTVSNLYATLGAPAISGSSPPTFMGMPGPVLGALALVSALIAASILVAQTCASSLTALPGFAVLCRVTREGAPQQAPSAVMFVRDRFSLFPICGEAPSALTFSHLPQICPSNWASILSLSPLSLTA